MLSVILTFQFMSCLQISVYNMYKTYATQETAVTRLVMSKFVLVVVFFQQ